MCLKYHREPEFLTKLSGSGKIKAWEIQISYNQNYGKDSKSYIVDVYSFCFQIYLSDSYNPSYNFINKFFKMTKLSTIYLIESFNPSVLEKYIRSSK